MKVIFESTFSLTNTKSAAVHRKTESFFSLLPSPQRTPLEGIVWVTLSIFYVLYTYLQYILYICARITHIRFPFKTHIILQLSLFFSLIYHKTIPVVVDKYLSF